MKEHLLKSTGSASAVNEHCTQTSHTIVPENAKILVREDKFWSRKIREAVEITTQKPTLNRDCGYELPHIYLNLLLPLRRQMSLHSIANARDEITQHSTDEDPEMGVESSGLRPKNRH